MTGRCQPPYRHFERKREIFVIRGHTVDVWKPQTGNLQSRILRASPYLYSAALLYFYAPHLHFSFLIQARLSNAVKGWHAPWANPIHISKQLSTNNYSENQHV